MKKIIFVLIVLFNFVGYSQPQFLTRSQLEKWIESSEKYTYTGDRNIFRVFVRHRATMIREAYKEKDSPIFEQIVNAFAEHLQFEKEYEHHPNEKPYSCSAIQEGYNDYLRIVFKKEEINYFRHNFNWITKSDLKIVCEELNEIKKDDFAKEIIPEIELSFEEIFFKYKDSFLFRYKILLALEFEDEQVSLGNRTYRHKFYIENKERKEELKSKMDEYIKEITLEGNNLIKDHRECYIFCRNMYCALSNAKKSQQIRCWDFFNLVFM